MTAAELVASLADRLGVEDYSTDDPNRWRIVFDTDLTIDFVANDSKKIAMEAVLCPLPEEDWQAETLLRRVLEHQLVELNRFVQHVVFLDEESGFLCMYRTENADSSDGESFAAAVEDFVNAAEAWTSEVSTATGFFAGAFQRM